MKVKEIISEINNNDFYSINSAAKAVELRKSDIVVENYNFSKHRNFDITTNIYRCDNGFVAITGLINDRSKVGYEEYNIPAFAEEYIEIPTVTYAPKYRR